MIKVKLTPEQARLIEAHPASQVIPSQHMAGFDVVFSGKSVERFEDDVTVLVNGTHTVSFKLCAETISMDLQLSASSSSSTSAWCSM